MTEVLLNDCHGRFQLSEEAMDLYIERTSGSQPFLHRHDPIMVQIVRELGVLADGDSSSIVIRRLPDHWGCNYTVVCDPTGFERVVHAVQSD